MSKLAVLSAIVLCAWNLSFAQDNGMTEDEMMQKWLEAASPGPQHALLAKRAGEWDTTIKYWMEPGGEAMESHGTRTYEVLNGGRVVGEASYSEMMGIPFEAHGMTGYDNSKKMYWSTWTDNMATSALYMEGTSSDSGKTVVYDTAEENLITGEKDPVRFITRWVSDDTHVLESWHGVGTPNEFKMVEITCTRKK
ncbi:MAG: DUF1579 family protein [Calditrichaeota bacterium]|nr:DUF1579 family protein [Calditrichota bacterium]